MFVFSPGQQAVVPVWGRKDDYFPVHRIYCVGRNYRAHDLEMGGTGRSLPCFFMKPADAVFPVADNDIAEIPYPPMTNDLHHEVELVAAIGKGGRNIPVEEAAKHVWGWAVAVDLTRRDLQAEAKAKGRPWEAAKAFDHSAPISYIRPAAKCPAMDKADVWLYINAEKRQNGTTADMIWELAPGDLILTGTPGGVGAVNRGETVNAGVSGAGAVRFKLV